MEVKKKVHWIDVLECNHVIFVLVQSLEAIRACKAEEYAECGCSRGATQEVVSTVSVFLQEVQAPASYAGCISVRS